MLKIYLKIAWRNLLQNKGYSAITIFGLALGLAVSLLSILYVIDELGFDRFNAKSDRIYRVNSDIVFSKKEMHGAASPTPIGQTLKQDLPEVEAFTRLGRAESRLVKSDRSAIREQRILYADSTIFDVFTLPVLAGNPSKALTDPQSVVITRSMAAKYFGKTDPLNKILVFDNQDSRKVTAVIEDIPARSHFQADFLLPLFATRDAKVNKWGNHIFNTYLLLKPGTEPAAVEAKFENILRVYLDPSLRRFFNTTLAEFRKKGNDYKYSLIPLTDIHLYSNREGELAPNNSIEYIYLFGVIAFFILLIAICNFVNISTARAARRAREVGVRKVLGSGRSVLILQFQAESMLSTVLSLVIGIGLLSMLLPYFNQFSGKNLNLPDITSFAAVSCLLAGTVLVGLLAGVYPAFYLSSFEPVKTLKGKLWVQPGRQGVRDYLVVFQFALSIILLVSTLLVNRQLRYIQTRNLGFGKEEVLVVKTLQSDKSELQAFKEHVIQSPSVKMATVSGFLPVTSRRWNDMWFPEGQTNERYAVNMQEWKVDADYIGTLGMKLVRGRNFDERRATDSTAVVINETAAKRLGYADPIGKIIHKTGEEKLTIIGVVEDFHFESLRSNIEPLLLAVSSAALGQSVEKASLESVTLRLQKNTSAHSLALIEKIWKTTAPGRPFEYSFLSDDFDSMYKAEQRIEQIFSAFSAIAILIACLGLFGLSAFSAEQRIAEIGVRKVLGSSVTGIVLLLSRDFLKPVGLAVIIASPIAWYGITFWLQGFAYKTDISVWVFVVAACLAAGIALLTVGFHAIKAGLTNPIRSLRNE